MELEILLDRYLKYKEVIEAIEAGDWHQNKAIANLTIEQVMNLKFIISQLERLGIEKLPASQPN